MRIFVHLLLLLTLTSFSFAADKARSHQEDAIRETVFRHQFGHNASGQQERANSYFLAIGESDANPSGELMKRFVRHKPPVRKVSECSTVKARVVDKKTGKSGLIFRVRSIKWISDLEVEVKGGYSEHLLSASGNTYTLTKKDGKWQVTKDGMDWIS